MKNSYNNNKFSFKALLCAVAAIFLFISVPKNSNAVVYYYDQDNSCASDLNFFLKLGKSVQTLGAFEAISKNFIMTHKDAEGKEVSFVNPSTGKTETKTRCFDATENNIKFCYDPFFWSGGVRDAFTGGDGSPKCGPDNPPVIDRDKSIDGHTVRDNIVTMLPNKKTLYHGGAWWRSIYKEDKICVQVHLVFGWSDMGCKYRRDITQISEKVNCNLAKSCYQTVADESKSGFPVTGSIVQCFTQTVKTLFEDPAGYVDTQQCSGQENQAAPFVEFQSNMKNVIVSLLTLFIIFTSIRIALGAEQFRKHEFFIFILKFAAVFYFAIGPGGKDLVNIALDLMYGFADLMFQAGGNQDILCKFAESEYDQYPYLRLWDGVDCRIAHYFGFSPSFPGYGNLLALAGASIFAYPLLFILTIIFAIFVLSIVAFIVNTYLIAILSITILIYLSPLFIPLVLFKATKSYFDGWLKLLLGYILQPAILFAFLALMFTVYDKTFYGECEFARIETDLRLPSKPISTRDAGAATNPGQSQSFETFGVSTFTVSSQSANNPKCNQSIGFMINPATAADIAAGKNPQQVFLDLNMEEKTTLFGKVYAIKETVGPPDMNKAYLTLIFFTYLFYVFSKTIGDLAGDLTNTNVLSQSAAVGPTAIMDKAGSAVKGAVDTMIGAPSSKDPTVTTDAKGKDAPEAPVASKPRTSTTPPKNNPGAGNNAK